MPKLSEHRRGEPLTKAERDFIRDAYPALGPAAIARKLGRSRSGVCNVIAQMKESGVIESKQATTRPARSDGPEAPPADGPDGAQDTLGRLRWVRRVIERQLYVAEPTTAARLAKEYRDTVEAIDRLERQGEGGDDAIGGIAALIAQKLG